MNGKRLVLLVIFIFAIVLLCCGIFIFKANVTNEVSEEVGLTSNKKYKDLIIKDIEIIDDQYSKEGIKQLTFNIYNESTKKFAGEFVKITFLDKDDKTICETYTYIPDIKNKQSTRISMTIESKCVVAYTFKIEKEEKGEINEIK